MIFLYARCYQQLCCKQNRLILKLKGIRGTVSKWLKLNITYLITEFAMNGSSSSDSLIAGIVTDYVFYRLRKNGINIPVVNGGTPNGHLTKRIHTSVRTLCDEFEQKYETIFGELCAQLETEMNGSVGFEASFLAVINELFAEGITWSRIVALFTLSGAVCLKFATKGEIQNMRSIIEWTCLYIKTNLNHWIDDHDGWDGLIEFSEGHPDKRLESPWPTFKKFVCSIAAGALGALTIGAILTSKT